jgi:ABC-type Zn uptake system ZnuABC Zn-binding protein ZnuA
MQCKRRQCLLAIGIAGVALIAVSGCPKISDPWEGQPGKHVLTSFAPLYCFTQNVAGADASVKIATSDTGPHEFNPAPADVKLVKGADMFVINGLDLDNEIARKMINGSRNKSVPLVVAGQAIPEKELRENEDQEHGADEGEHHHHGKHDPHVWLGVPEAIKMVAKIRDELAAIDPEHADGYKSRGNDYIDKLEKLVADGKAMFKDKKERRIIAFHDSLGYFARTFGLEIVDCVEIAPGVEPSAKKMQELIDLCLKEKVRIIAVEPQYPSNTAAQVVLTALKKKGVDAQFVEVDPLETAKFEDLTPDYYERKMKENLKRLADALK